MANPAFPLRVVDWPAVRKAFIESPERATYAELAAQFHVSEDRVKRAAADEGWSILRARYLEQQLVACGAASAIVEAAKTDTVLLGKFANSAMEVIRQVDGTLADLEKRKLAPGTRMNVINSATFALSNLANALHRVGVVGIPKSLKDAADAGNGRWSPELLKGINISIANVMQSTADAARIRAAEVTPAQPASPPATVDGKHPMEVDVL